MASEHPVNDLETALTAMLSLKPPGVSGSRISSLTSLCVANIKSESVLIQKIYTHFKRAPGTHKLGVLYVVDSVTRKWLEQAKAQGQQVNSSAPDGTYAAGVHRVTELMPVLWNDISQSAPAEQKEKLKKLIDIWEKGSTFCASLLESFKEKLKAPGPPQVSTTPPGSPPKDALASLGVGAPAPAPSAPVNNGQSILDALANIARQNTAAASNNTAPGPAPSYSMPHAASGLSQPVPSSMSQPQPPVPYPQTSQPAVNFPPSMPFNLPQTIGQGAPQGFNIPANQPNAQFPNAPPALGGVLNPNTQQQILLIKALVDQGVPIDKIPAIIAGLNAGGAVPGASVPAQPPVSAPQNSYGAPGQPSWGTPQPEQARDWYNKDYNNKDSTRSPPRLGGRSRSRSPDRGWGNRNGRNMDYGSRNSPSRGRDDRRGGDEYRNRSPPRRRGQSPPPMEKWTDHDPNLPSGSIKVLSRTLFVGGVTCSEQELRGIFGQWGNVQTCIVNKDKRHAFIKMLTRKDAVNVKANTEEGSRNMDIPLRTRWGVGFGPRDCSDYATGVSIIPIHRLTEADRKWMLTAPQGGSGGRPIATGLVVEEPDIEIGAGVSSKAISRRMQTDKGGANGPKSTRHRDDWGGNNNRARGRNEDDGQQQWQGQGQQGFPFGLGTLPNGMPNFPAGFSFPDPGNVNGQNKWA